jgi:hypothetical protein
MKTFYGKIVAMDMADNTITIRVENLEGAKGAVAGEEVKIESVPPVYLDPDIHELVRRG